jgi:hypothetical protein
VKAAFDVSTFASRFANISWALFPFSPHKKGLDARQDQGFACRKLRECTAMEAGVWQLNVIARTAFAEGMIEGEGR